MELGQSKKSNIINNQHIYDDMNDAVTKINELEKIINDKIDQLKLSNQNYLEPLLRKRNIDDNFTPLKIGQ